VNLKRQLLLVSLLTLVLPWAGYRFIRETESALRAGQQDNLAATARLVAEGLAQYPEEFAAVDDSAGLADEQLYGHRLEARPEIDGYFDDWTIERESLSSLRGVDGPILFALGLFDQAVYVYVEVPDRTLVYAEPGAIAIDEGPPFADRVRLVSNNPPYREERLVFAAEAPGPIITYVQTGFGFAPEPTILAHWQDVPGGYQLEARIPARELGTHLGLVVSNAADVRQPPVRSATFSSRGPGEFMRLSPDLTGIAETLVQPGMRLFVTDARGWRIAEAGNLVTDTPATAGSRWLRLAYDALVESGGEARLAGPDPSGREQQGYVQRALDGEASQTWFRSADSGKAIVAAAQPVVIRNRAVGAVILQQGTEAILSLRDQGLAQLINVTLVATLLVAATLLGYATWLSRRIRRLSVAAEDALDSRDLRVSLPSAGAGDEIGDLSRSFSYVLRQLGDYNDYLRSLASKLSHELRTPLAIVTSSLENLEHEPLGDAAKGYASRARDGTDRLRRILTAMSEASRVEELMQNAEPEPFDLAAALDATVEAYRDVYPARQFDLRCGVEAAPMGGSPELVIQMLDKLIDNAVDFSVGGDTITVDLSRKDQFYILTITNPGPPLPERMRAKLFESMVSMRPGDDGRHLGLGLYVARLIAEGHGGTITAENTDGGVAVSVTLRGDAHGE